MQDRIKGIKKSFPFNSPYISNYLIFHCLIFVYSKFVVESSYFYCPLCRKIGAYSSLYKFTLFSQLGFTLLFTYNIIISFYLSLLFIYSIPNRLSRYVTYFVLSCFSILKKPKNTISDEDYSYE